MITLYGFGTSLPGESARRKTCARSGRSRRRGCRIEFTRSTTPAASSTATPTAGSARSTRCRSSMTTASWWPSRRAVVLYLAEKAGKLIPGDVQGRTRVVQWCLAAASTVGATLMCIDMVEIFDSEQGAPKLHAGVREIADRFLGDVERRLEDRAWIACDDFTVADIMMANVLRSVRKTDLMERFPKLEGLLRALSCTSGLAAHARAVRRAARREASTTSASAHSISARCYGPRSISVVKPTGFHATPRTGSRRWNS